MKEKSNIGSKKEFFSFLRDTLSSEKTKKFRMDNGIMGSLTFEYAFEKCSLAYSGENEAHDLHIYGINPTIHVDIEPIKKHKQYGEYHRNEHEFFLEWYNKTGEKMSISTFLDEKK